jgi:hypothetical protein
MDIELIGVIIKAKLGMEMGRAVRLHEVPLLQGFYGDSKIIVDPPSLVSFKGKLIKDGKQVTVNAYEEYQRLMKKYAPKEPGQANILPTIFVSPEHMESYAKEHAFEGVSKASNSSVPDGITDTATVSKIQRRRDVMRALDERGVKYSKNTRTDMLETKLRDILVEEADAA